MRLIQGTLYNDGGAVHSSAMGRLGCAAIITAIKEDKCRYIVPGNGDRIFGMTQILRWLSSSRHLRWTTCWMV
jgi:uncharacterized protein (DUF169 family)